MALSRASLLAGVSMALPRGWSVLIIFLFVFYCCPVNFFKSFGNTY